MKKYDFKTVMNHEAFFERKGNLEYLQQSWPNADSNWINTTIADLNFKIPEAIIQQIKVRADYPSYSYSYVPSKVYVAIQQWYQQRHNVKLEESWIKLVHGTVNALHQLVQAFSKPGDNIIIQTPVYGPFERAIKNNQRNVVTNPLLIQGDNYALDFVDLEQKMQTTHPVMMIFCSPHNPGGKIWNVRDLKKIIELCDKYNVLLVSDEVHSDLTHPTQHFTSVLELMTNQKNIIVCNSPNKAFNLGGLKSSYLIIPNTQIKAQVEMQYKINSITSPNVFTIEALHAAYTNPECQSWLRQLTAEFRTNCDFLLQSLAHLSFLKIFNPQASFLVWIDYTQANFSAAQLEQSCLEHKLIISGAEDFTMDATAKYLRINIGTPLSELKEIIARLNHAINALIKK